MLISKAQQGFVLSKQADGRAYDTIRNHTWFLKLLRSHLGDVEVETITSDQLKEFFVWLQQSYRTKHGNHLSNRTLASLWISMRAFFTWAVTELRLPSRPDTTIKRPRYIDPPVEPFTIEEIQKLLKACETIFVNGSEWQDARIQPRHTAARDQAIIHVLLSVGLRVSELCRLRIEDYTHETGEITVKPFRSSYKSRPRHVFVGKVGRKVLWKYLSTRKNPKPQETLFLARKGRPMTRNSVRLLLGRLGKRAGVNNCHPHRFRHTCAIMRLRNGLDPFNLSVMLGHSDMTMTKRYVNLSKRDTEQAMSETDPMDKRSN